MDDKKFLKALVQETLISEELAQQITVESSQTGKSAEEILYTRHLIDEVTAAKTKSKLLGIPYQKVKPENITEELLKFVPQETAEAYSVVPMALKDKVKF